MKKIIKLSSLAVAMMLITVVSFAQKVLVDANKNYSNIKAIEVSGGWLDVSFTGGTNSDVHVEAYLESNEENQDIIFVTVGDVLKISYEQSSRTSSWGNNRNKGFIKITGPMNIDLDMKNSSGTLTVDKVVGDQTNLRVSSGKITATNISGDLAIKASSGALFIDKVSGNIDAGITSGNADINNVGGNLNYQSTSGSLTADRVKGQLSVALTSGNAKLSNIGSLGSMKFTSGNIRATNAGLSGNTNFNGTSGNFKIQTPSNLKNYNFSLKASSGNLRVGGINTGKNLEIDNDAAAWVKGSISSGNITIEN
ncbi:DUF4097 family beta strand repeat-containing protein [Algoriphagus sp. C2-6-M1]|uniref:DUF4097 family beta strand repeat-containing protein n=1 Tax=Algoriphagus persicinus TaxID=3108754 RepID=UPI002B3E2604|nr:DUF4097 family beta strand repeat-containing protein [Algoriphagus sp. C2-6-M1]MEB2781282.1 DUF4097 family beta strand repeat-containing protein [Algoriphagus sp. C2-6-M1]